MSVQYPVSYLVGRTRSLLLGTSREQLNQIATGKNVATTDTTIYIQNNPSSNGPGVITGGDVISVDDELMYVWSVSGQSSGSMISVYRGWNGSTPAAHNALALVWINPYYSQYEIRNALKDDIRSWGPQVFAVKSVLLNTTDFVQGYDLANLVNLIQVLDVRISPDQLISTPPDLEWPQVAFEVIQTIADSTDFPSGNALIITEPGGIFDSPRQLNVIYASYFNVDATDGVGNPTFQDGDDLIATVGLDPSDLDIAPLGAAWRLLLTRELRRDTSEVMGSSGDLQNHPETAAMQVAAQLKKMRDSRLHDAEIRLRAKWPYVRV